MDYKKNKVNFYDIIARFKAHKLLFLWVLSTTFIISCLIILPIPRYYISTISLAPELNNANSLKGSLSDIASNFGFSIDGNTPGDAISPNLYPELMKSNNFIHTIANCRIETSDGKLRTTYYKYLKHYQKKNPVLSPLTSFMRLFLEEETSTEDRAINPFQLTKAQDKVFSTIKENLSCEIDIKTGLITISVKDQDPLVAASMVDFVKIQLQSFITEYRTSKAKKDEKYYARLTSEAKVAYEKSRQRYSSYSDANFDAILQSVKSKEEDLENDMQLKFNTYSAMNNQLQLAKARVQEKTPAFTVVTNASIPLKPAGPKRMAFVLAMLLFSFTITSIIINRDLFFLHESV